MGAWKRVLQGTYVTDGTNETDGVTMQFCNCFSMHIEVLGINYILSMKRATL
jgi:hypothetical protein